MKLTSLPQFARNANRVREIVTILSKHGLADGFSRLDLEFVRSLLKRPEGFGFADLSHEARIRLALTELGTTFIKLGQMLSTRADLIGPELARELTALQTDAPADPPAVVRETIHAELGKSTEELFTEFDDKPLASASIGQVHRARLPNGQAVVVKVQHAGIVGRIRNDLEILAALVDLIEDYVAELRPYRPRTTAAEFQRMLLRELDFGREERNLRQFARHFAGDGSVHFPTTYPALCTSRVLTMELLEGTPLADPQQLRSAGLDLEDLAKRGARVFLEMIFRDGFYHADPHPGNMIVLQGGVIGMLDCGMVGRLDDTVREQIEAMLMALAHREVDQLTTVLTRIASVPPELDHADLTHAVSEFLADYSNVPFDQLDLGAALTELTAIIRRFHVALPTSLAVLIKVLVMLEGTSRLLNPRFNLTELLQPYYQKLMWRRLSPARQMKRLGRLYQELEYLGEVLPRSLVDILQQVQTGKFEVHLEHKRLEPSVNRLVLGMLTSALFLGSALLWSNGVGPLLGQTSIPGVLGCGCSLLLGVRLLWAIKKSGKLDR